MKRFIVRHPLAIIAAALLTIMGSARAHAVVSVTTCGTTCTSACQLANNLSCDSGVGVTLSNGASLDLNGHYISCTSVDPGNPCTAGVAMTGPGSVVFTSVAPGLSTPSVGILGNWFRGVDCAAQPNSRVTGVQFRGFFGDSSLGGAIFKCQTVDGNTVAALPDPTQAGVPDPVSGVFVVWTRNCIVHTSIATSDLIVSNHLDGCKTAVLRTGGSLALTIDSNNINCRDLTPPLTPPMNCIDLSTTSRPTTVSNNIIEGDSRGLVIQAPTSGATFQNNTCKLGLRGCSTCVSQGRCVANGTTTSP